MYIEFLLSDKNTEKILYSKSNKKLQEQNTKHFKGEPNGLTWAQISCNLICQLSLTFIYK